MAYKLSQPSPKLNKHALIMIKSMTLAVIVHSGDLLLNPFQFSTHLELLIYSNSMLNWSEIN